ncbi:hypothetical protein DESA109040_07905 [Deinococcus saxicola]
MPIISSHGSGVSGDSSRPVMPAALTSAVPTASGTSSLGRAASTGTASVKGSCTTLANASSNPAWAAVKPLSWSTLGSQVSHVKKTSD